MGTDYSGTGWKYHLEWRWHLKFAWLPAKMDSGEFIWWRKYYHGIRLVHGPGTPVILHQYMTAEEFTWKALQES